MKHPWQLFNIFWQGANASANAGNSSAGPGGDGDGTSGEGVTSSVSVGPSTSVNTTNMGNVSTATGGLGTGFGVADMGNVGVTQGGGTASGGSASGAAANAGYGGNTGYASGGVTAQSLGTGLSAVAQQALAYARSGIMSPLSMFSSPAAAANLKSNFPGVAALSDQDKAAFATKLRSGYQAPQNFGDVSVNSLYPGAGPSPGLSSLSPNALQNLRNQLIAQTGLVGPPGSVTAPGVKSSTGMGISAQDVDNYLAGLSHGANMGAPAAGIAATPTGGYANALGAPGGSSVGQSTIGYGVNQVGVPGVTSAPVQGPNVANMPSINASNMMGQVAPGFSYGTTAHSNMMAQNIAANTGSTAPSGSSYARADVPPPGAGRR